MINPFLEINWRPGNKEIRKFGVTILIGFVAIGLVLFAINLFKMPLNQAVVIPLWLVGVGVAVSVIALAIPPAALPFYYVWFAVSGAIGLVISNTLLILFYYIFFSVFSMLFRLLSQRDPLFLKRKSNMCSYWADAPDQNKVSRYLKQY